MKRKQLQKLDVPQLKSRKTKTDPPPTRTYELCSQSGAPYRLTNDNAKIGSIIIDSYTLV